MVDEDMVVQVSETLAHSHTLAFQKAWLARLLGRMQPCYPVHNKGKQQRKQAKLVHEHRLKPRLIAPIWHPS